MAHFPRAILAPAFAAAFIATSHGHQQPSEVPPPFIDPCLRDGAKFVGTQPTYPKSKGGGKLGLPKKIKNVEPQYPPLPPGTKGSGIWIAHVLIDKEGKVVNIWPAREPVLTPPFPAFTDAIVAAVRQWQYEPHLLPEVGATPVCRILSLTPKWK